MGFERGDHKVGRQKNRGGLGKQEPKTFHADSREGCTVSAAYALNCRAGVNALLGKPLYYPRRQMNLRRPGTLQGCYGLRRTHHSHSSAGAPQAAGRLRLQRVRRVLPGSALPIGHGVVTQTTRWLRCFALEPPGRSLPLRCGRGSPGRVGARFSAVVGLVGERSGTCVASLGLALDSGRTGLRQQLGDCFKGFADNSLSKSCINPTERRCSGDTA